MRLSSKTAARGAVIGATEAILGMLESYLHLPIPLSELLVPTSYIKGIGKGAIIGTTIGKAIAYALGPQSPYTAAVALVDVPLTAVNSSIAYACGKYKLGDFGGKLNLSKIQAVYWPVLLNSLAISYLMTKVYNIPVDFAAASNVVFLLLLGLQGIPQYLMLRILEKRIKE